MQTTPAKPFRILNRDGSFNISRTFKKNIILFDPYHFLLSISWFQFIGLVAASYLTTNLFFGSLYFLAGKDALEGVQLQSTYRHFLDCFFFSVQTLATIGYGRIGPNGLWPNILVAIEAFIGLLGLALVTGLLFARFARPTARVAFSKVAIIGKHNGQPTLMFRMANERLNQIIEAHVHVVLIRNYTNQEGDSTRKMYDLQLERDRTPNFGLTWTVRHTIDEKSPLYQTTPSDLATMEAEIFISLMGHDDTFSQNIHARFSYTAEDIVWDHRFHDMVVRREDGRVHVELHKIHDVEPRA